MKRWNPSTWASRRPFGVGEQHPNNYLEIWKAFRENRGRRRYAWRILRDGVCDGCALGTSGMRDWTIDGVHLCNIRLRLLPLNTMDALDERVLADVAPLKDTRSAELRDLGRLPYPMLRRAGEPGFTRIGWDDALDRIASRIKSTDPSRLGFYLTSRGMPNESYYAAAKAVRAMGTNSIDNAARVCHSPSTFALKDSLGVAATTCSYTDWIGSDVVVFIGSNVANNQPVAMKYLHEAKRAGTKILCVNTYREPGMERYWIPSTVESAVFGTKIADRFFLVRVGGDLAFLTGALKHLIERDLVDRTFIADRTNGFDALRDDVTSRSWTDLEAASGTRRDEMRAFAEALGAARTGVLVWSMGVTQHTTGEDNVRAIVNLGLARGFVGRERCGLMPIRGHSGVQGGAEMGAYATAFPGGVPVDQVSAARFSELWGFQVPSGRGLTAPEMLEDGRLDVLFSAGGNFVEVLPQPSAVEAALARITLRVHMDIVVTNQMLVDPCDEVVLLPAATRYEIEGGVTETSTERRVIFSPEIDGRRIGEARGEWQVFGELAARVRPGFAPFASTAAVREEIARVVPAYDGMQHLRAKGDQFQIGGRDLCAGQVFATPDGRARFTMPAVPAPAEMDGRFVLATRRGKQFNSMVHEQVDAITGAARTDVLINADDAARLGLRDGDAVLLRSEAGSFRGRARIAGVHAGTMQAHWPECSPLIDRHRRSREAGIPDYNALVTAERA